MAEVHLWALFEVFRALGARRNFNYHLAPGVLHDPSLPHLEGKVGIVGGAELESNAEMEQDGVQDRKAPHVQSLAQRTAPKASFLAPAGLTLGYSIPATGNL